MNYIKNNAISTSGSEYVWISISLVTLIGCFMRFYGLGEQSLWIDEIASWNQSRKSDIIEVIEGMRKNVHPPGWTFILHFSQRVFGDSPFALRLIPAIAGTLSIPAIYFLGRQILSSSASITAAVLMAFLWAPIYYSQESRAYALIILLSILTSLVLLKLCLELSKGRTNYLLASAYVVTSVLMAYLHYSGLLIVLMQGTWAFARQVKQKDRVLFIFGLFAIIALFYAPWILELLNDFKRDSFWVRTVASPFRVLDFFFFGKSFELYIPLTILITGLALFELFKNKNDLINWLLSPVGFLFIWLTFPYIAFFLKSILHARYILVSSPAAYLLVAYAISILIKNNVIKTFLIALVIAIFSIYILINDIKYYSSPQKAQFKEVVQLLIDSDDVLLDDTFLTSFRSSNVFNYYLSALGSKKRIDHRIENVKENGKRRVPNKEVRIIRESIMNKKTKHVWLIMNNPTPPVNVLKMLDQIGNLVRTERFRNTRAWLYKIEHDRIENLRDNRFEMKLDSN